MRKISKSQFEFIEEQLFLYNFGRSVIQNEIDKVLKELPYRKLELVKIRYFTKNNRLTWTGVALKLKLSRSQTFVWRDEIIHEIAKEMGSSDFQETKI